jgi:uncharacterized cupredoxin-like copper-binding protein
MTRQQVSMIGALCIFALAPAAWADWSKAETVTLVETDYRFAPDRLTFRAGSAYRLHIENHGKRLHEFTAPAFLKTVEIGNPEVLNPDRTEIVAHHGEQKDLYFVPNQAGHFPFSCADHDWAGMTGDIVVE